MSLHGSHPPAGPQQAGLSFNNANLASNNPFRNRPGATATPDASSVFASSTSPFDDPPPPQRPLSRNPFLDQQPSTQGATFRSSNTSSNTSSNNNSSNINNRSNARSLTAEDIFGSLTLDDRGSAGQKDLLIDFNSADSQPQQRQQKQQQQQQQQLLLLQQQRQQQQRRPTLSQEEALRARKPQFLLSKPLPAIDSPSRKAQRRPRRNSDSSLMDFDNRHFDDEDRKMADAKRREQHRRLDGKEKPRAGRPSRKMDIIDQLDATSIYGTGLFHHDGPFDALNPHRNRQNGRRLAPMQAFPKDSLNNTIGGAGPLNPRADHSQFMGHGTDEAFNDFATSGKKSSYGYSSSRETAIFDPVSRGNMVHGDESYGLGTSTFLEGTPAARSAIIRREAEYQQEVAEGGLQRKKSLAQRVRQIGKGPRDHNLSGRSLDQSRYGTSLGSEGGPYQQEINQADESVNVTKGRNGKLSPPPIPRRKSGSALEGQARAADTGTPLVLAPGSGPGSQGVLEEAPAKPLGLLGRMKSLKGGRRTSRNETP